VPQAQVAPPGPAAAAAQLQLVVPPSSGYEQTPSAAHPAPPAVHAPVGCAVGHVGHVVQVQTGFAPPPQSHTTLPNVHMPAPAVHALWLLGGVEGQVGGFPPLLLPLLLPLPPPLLLPLPPPLLLPLLLPPPLLPPLLLLAVPPLLLPLLLPDDASAPASPVASVLPEQPSTTTTPPVATPTMKRNSSALIGRPPQFAPWWNPSS
jgi:hypothetical protein